jgi:hypothetical protein
MIFTESAIADALTRRCELCKAAPDQPCRDICTGLELTDRAVHFCRLKTK